MESNDKVATKYPTLNYVKIRKLSLFSNYYVYVDTSDNYLADALFIEHKVPVKFIKEYAKKNLKYALIFCKINKRDDENFLKALERLPNKMLLMGNTDYIDFCKCLYSFLEDTK